MAPRALLVGNSDGIGLATTRRLLDDGWAVVGLSRSPSPLTHPSHQHVVTDVASPEFPAQRDRALGEDAPVDLCV